MWRDHFPHCIYLIDFYANESMFAAFILVCSCFHLHVLMAWMLKSLYWSDYTQNMPTHREKGGGHVSWNIKKYCHLQIPSTFQIFKDTGVPCDTVLGSRIWYYRKVTSVLTSRPGNFNTKCHGETPKLSKS